MVVIKNLLQTKAADHFEIISQMAKLIDFITVAAARASILWLIGEYSEKVPKIAPDVLRKMAKSFVEEVRTREYPNSHPSDTLLLQENMVKLQILNLSVKLHLNNPSQTELLCQYVFSLARYDENYDIRDRARFLKPFIFPPEGKETLLSRSARKIFLAAKPAPLLESKYQGREQFQLGSLSHYLNIRANGYHDLPPFSTEPPDSSVRDNDEHPEAPAAKDDRDDYYSAPNESYARISREKGENENSFYSETDKSSAEETSGSGAGSDESDEESSSSEEEESGESGSSDSDSDSGDSDEDSSASESNESSEESSSKSAPSSKAKPTAVKAPENRSNLDLLLDLSDIAPSGPIMTPSLGGFLSPIANAASGAGSRYELVGPSYIPLAKNELLNKINGHGLQIHYRFTRSPHLFSGRMVSIELTLKNDSTKELESIRVGDKSALGSGVQLNDFAPIAKLYPGQAVQCVLGVDFNDSTQSVGFEIATSEGNARVSLKASIGEIIRSISIGENVFRDEQARLCGMNEHSASVAVGEAATIAAIRGKVFDVANVAALAHTGSSHTLLFAGQTMASQSLVLVSISLDPNERKAELTVNCEKMVVGSMLLNDIKSALKF